MPELIVSEKPYEKHEGTACFAPYVNVSISALTGRKQVEVSFKARIDTGADITCIPSEKAKMLMPLLLGKPVLIRAHDGSIKRARTHLVIISIHSYPQGEEVKTYRPERGVLLTDSDIGLIGMDIISKYWKLNFDGIAHRFSVESA
ncbi:hypothetical protein GF312_22590 [Candidatus Poribacteria bacterium]|nr:hypothetical protein [Candidatus Poribacteria bacterium]